MCHSWYALMIFILHNNVYVCFHMYLYICAVFFSTEFNASPAVSVLQCHGRSCVVCVGLRCCTMRASSLLKMKAKWPTPGEQVLQQSVCIEVFELSCFGMLIIAIENKTHSPCLCVCVCEYIAFDVASTFAITVCFCIMTCECELFNVFFYICVLVHTYCMYLHMYIYM